MTHPAAAAAVTDRRYSLAHGQGVDEYVRLTKPKLLWWERPAGRDRCRERPRERSVTPRLARTLGPPAFPRPSRVEARSHKAFCQAL